MSDLVLILYIEASRPTGIYQYVHLRNRRDVEEKIATYLREAGEDRAEPIRDVRGREFHLPWIQKTKGVIVKVRFKSENVRARRRNRDVRV